MADLELLADRLAITDVLTRYAWSLDTKAFDGLDDVFTADAHIDYTSSGGPKGPFPEVKAWLASVLPHFPVYQHLVTNIDVRLDGDRIAHDALDGIASGVDLGLDALDHDALPSIRGFLHGFDGVSGGAPATRCRRCLQARVSVTKIIRS